MDFKNVIIKKLRSAVVMMLALSLVVSCVVLQGCQEKKETAKTKKAYEFGIDIEKTGGVEWVFVLDLDLDNDGKDDIDLDTITDDDLDSMKSGIESKMAEMNIFRHDVNVDYDAKEFRVCFAWSAAEKNFDVMHMIEEIGKKSSLTFYKGNDNTGEVVLQGAADIAGAAYGGYDTENGSYMISLEFTERGTAKFAKATKEMIGKQISIYMDETLLSAPTVNSQITDGKAIITGMASAEETTEFVKKINLGILPYWFAIDNSTIRAFSPNGEQIYP